MKKVVKKSLIITVLLTGIMMISQAQDFLPFLNDNRAGINQVMLQPASIANGRNSIDINIIGFSSQIRSDFIRFERGATINLAREYDDPNWMQNNSYMDDPDGVGKNAIFNFQAVLPSFMITLDNKQSFGFIARARDIQNAVNIDEPLARSIYTEYKDDYSWQQYDKGGSWHTGEDISGVHHSFAEYGVVYARELMNKDEHYLKGGATLKLLQGMASTFLWADDLTYWLEKDPETVDQNEPESLDADSASWNSSYIHFGTSENWRTQDSYPIPPFDQFAFTAKISAGFDIGFVYEWRPDHEEYEYEMDGKKGERKDLNKYKIKAGVSVIDIGRLNYEKYKINDFRTNFTPGYPQVMPGSGNTSWMRLDEVEMQNVPYYDFADTVSGRVDAGDAELIAGAPETYKVKLPTALSFQFDYAIDQNFYVNLTSFTSLVKSKAGKPSTEYISNYSITPRYEGRWFGAAIPVQYNGYNHFLVGMGLRLGILWLGTNDLLSLIGISEGYGSSIQFALKLPIPYKEPPSDIDGDRISDAKDKCPTVPGVLEFQGCPDKDRDGVPDNEDLCPDDPGLIEYDGCPDRDADGIIDKLDDCPGEPGLEEFNGCPDTDGDGIIDRDDRCPNTAGISAFFGCPDTDGDGIPDNEDLCPTEPGLAQNQGCPYLDTDSDGVRDEDDECPNEAGPKENNGCPYADTDGDSVLDKDDRCPLTPGDPSNNGCPVIKEADLAIINSAFKNLEFETNKAIIMAGSYSALNELAKLLKKNPEWKIRIAGHTDSQGSDSYNMELSKKRAQSTANYLNKQGVEDERIIVEWYGETMPIADNSTASGRGQNRRVEMEIVFD